MDRQRDTDRYGKVAHTELKLELAGEQPSRRENDDDDDLRRLRLPAGLRGSCGNRAGRGIITQI